MSNGKLLMVACRYIRLRWMRRRVEGLVGLGFGFGCLRAWRRWVL